MTANAITTNQSHPLNGSGMGEMLTRYSKRPTTQPRIIRVTTIETRDSMPIEFPFHGRGSSLCLASASATAFSAAGPAATSAAGGAATAAAGGAATAAASGATSAAAVLAAATTPGDVGLEPGPVPVRLATILFWASSLSLLPCDDPKKKSTIVVNLATKAPSSMLTTVITD